MLKSAPDSRPTPHGGMKYFFVDPIRIAAMACAVALMFSSNPIPMWLTVAAIAISQANGIAMIVGIVGRGWSHRWGRRGREAILTSTLAGDWTNTSVCTMVGAMLLIRWYGPSEMVLALGLLALGIGLLPDVRFCRAMLSSDAGVASRTLSDGFFWRDPVKLGGLIALLILCTLDQISLTFIFLSMALLQLNSILILVDKYITEIELGGTAVIFRNPAIRMFLARDGQRLLITILPFLFVPFRLLVGQVEANWTAGIVAGLIVIPDLLRAVARAFGESPRPAKPGFATGPSDPV